MEQPTPPIGDEFEDKHELETWFLETEEDYEKVMMEAEGWGVFPGNQGQYPAFHAYKHKGEIVGAMFDNGHGGSKKDFEDHPHRAYSFSVGVHPEWQGKGLEMRLVESLLDIQLDQRRALDYSQEMVVEVVEKDQPDVIAALRLHGFALVGVDRSFDYSTLFVFKYPAPPVDQNNFEPSLLPHPLLAKIATLLSKKIGESRLLPDSFPVTFEP